ncbi:cell division protein FtsQ/DivIB [Aeromonas rivuli]|uniref:cell division protein FtsQ/DivIB n=1 Tax=Aeromonas rivuli TaxID=648794 RepID=UPI0005A70296|nr:cell division protein FtsQ/DivIB [Aeromonas rivuli]
MEARAQGRTKGGFIIGVTFFLLVMAGLYQSALDVKDWLTDANRLPISALLVQGQHQYIKAEELRSAVLDGDAPRNFFEMDVNALQTRLTALPWVAQVSVRKKWPDKIKVYLTEQKVAARWNGDRFINAKGELFSAPNRVKSPLMQLSGPDDQAAKVLENSHHFEAQLAERGYKLSAVNLTPRYGWELTLDNNVQLFVGRSDMALRLQRFIDVFPIIEPREQVAYVDLRYDTGMAVGWKKNEEKAHDQNRR